MRSTITCSVACLFFLVLYCGCLERENGNVVTMTMEDLVDDYNYTTDATIKKYSSWYESLDGGDILLVRDTIYDLMYQQDGNYTLVAFTSLVNAPAFKFEGDITDNFKKRDVVEVKIHIIDVSYTDINPYTNETWTIEIEAFEEGINMETHDSVPFLQTVINHANSEGKIVTMTMQEFVDDYNYTMDETIKKYSRWFESLDGGDTLLIKDTIYNVSYQEDKNYTLMSMESLPNMTYSLPFWGDITDNFTKGVKVEVKIHIIGVLYTDINPYTNETWAFEIETFEEGIDMETYESLPFPQEVINRVES